MCERKHSTAITQNTLEHYIYIYTHTFFFNMFFVFVSSIHFTKVFLSKAVYSVTQKRFSC